MKEESIIFDGEQAEGLYSDGVPFSCLGKPQIERYSNVEFNNSTGKWEAELAATGEIIATDKSREACIERERQYFYQQNGIEGVSGRDPERRLWKLAYRFGRAIGNAIRNRQIKIIAFTFKLSRDLRAVRLVQASHHSRHQRSDDVEHLG